MAQAYSEDFRRKVIEAIELNGLKKQEASEAFRISHNTINLWFKLKAETADLKPRQRHGNPPAGKISDWDKFRALVAEHGNKTQAEIAKLWQGGVSQWTIFLALQRIGYTRKKRTAIENGMKPNGKRSQNRLTIRKQRIWCTWMSHEWMSETTVAMGMRSNRTVAEVAMQVGCEHLEHFATAFKQLGITLSQCLTGEKVFSSDENRR